MPVDIGRRDSARPAHASIQAEGYPMADAAAERISESAAAPHAEREQSGLKKRIDGQRLGTALAFSAVAPWERPEFAAHPIQHSEFPHPEYRILNSSLSGGFRQYLNLVGSVAWKQRVRRCAPLADTTANFQSAALGSPF
jgi:hypothetical protein